MRSSASFTVSLQLLIVSDITLWHVSKMEMLIHTPGLWELISQSHNHILHCGLFSYNKDDEFLVDVCGFNGQVWGGWGGRCLVRQMGCE